jgi:hypothetical protein
LIFHTKREKNQSYPGIFQPFGGFADNTPITKSRIGLTDIPGVGFEAKSALIDLFYDSFGKGQS